MWHQRQLPMCRRPRGAEDTTRCPPPLPSLPLARKREDPTPGRRMRSLAARSSLSPWGYRPGPKTMTARTTELEQEYQCHHGRCPNICFRTSRQALRGLLSNHIRRWRVYSRSSPSSCTKFASSARAAPLPPGSCTVVLRGRAL